MVSVMGETVGEHLPRTLRGLRERCVDAELAVHGGEYFVVYTFIDGKGREECFTGGNPLRPSWPEAGEDGYADNVRRVWEHVPESVRAFYERTHDGFHPFALEDEGILPLREVRALAGDDCLDGVDDDLGVLRRIAVGQRMRKVLGVVRQVPYDTRHTHAGSNPRRNGIFLPILGMKGFPCRGDRALSSGLGRG